MYFQKMWAKCRPEGETTSGGGAVTTTNEPAIEFDLGSAIDKVVEDIGGFDNDNTPALGTTDPAPAPKSAVAATPPAAPTPGPAAPVSAPVAGPVAAPPPARTTDLTVAPKTWRPEASALWASLPPPIQAEAHKREEDFFSGIETYKADAGIGKQTKEVLAPYMPALQHYRIDPFQQISGLMRAHHTLALGHPDEKKAMILSLCREFKIDLGIPAAAAPAGEQTFTDPQVAALQQQVTELQSRLNGTNHALVEDRKQKLAAEITAFATDPANPHFEEVANEITALIKGNPSMALKDAYAAAIWANPVVRQKLLDKQSADAEAARKSKEETDRKAAEAAARSASNVRTRAKPASATGGDGTMDDTLKETLAAIEARG